MIIPAARDCGSASSSQVALSRDLRVDCSGRTFLTYYYGIGGAKFSKKIEFLLELAISNGAQSIPVAAYCHREESLIFQEGNPLGGRIVSGGINHESAFVPATSRRTSKTLASNTSTHHDASICSLITRGNVV
jgi:hypothetical protein